MLVDTLEGIVNTDHVVSIEPTATGEKSIVTLVGGGTRTVRDASVFERACGTVVPVQPGFDVVTALLPGADETGVLYTVEPVLAFRIGAGINDHCPVPITVSGEPGIDPAMVWTVRQPNGACSGPDTAFDDLDAFKAECERQAARTRQAAE